MKPCNNAHVNTSIIPLCLLIFFTKPCSSFNIHVHEKPSIDRNFRTFRHHPRTSSLACSSKGSPYHSFSRSYSLSLSNDNESSLDSSETIKRKRKKKDTNLNKDEGGDEYHDDHGDHHPAADASSSPLSENMSLSNTLSNILDHDEDFQPQKEGGEEETETETVDQMEIFTENNNSNGSLPKDAQVKKPRSKAQIKKLKFLMMQDIETLLQDKIQPPSSQPRRISIVLKGYIARRNKKTTSLKSCSTTY
jgi:hypothetical protein